MASALGLLVLLPFWFLLSIAAPFGLLSLVPAVGLVSLGVGVVLGLRHPRRELLLFFIPFAVSEALVGVAGAMSGQVRVGFADPALVNLVNGGQFIFGAVQLAIAGCLIYLAKGARFAATALAIFSVAYAAFAIFVA